jgi:hypothetical protein
MGELERRLRVGVDEHLLHSGTIGGVIGDERGEHRVEMREPLGQCRLCIGLELAIGDMAQAVAVGADQAPARGAKPGVKAEDQA